MRRELSRWNPFQEFSSLQREMNELFRRVFGEGVFGTGVRTMTTWTPSIDFYSQGGGWIVRTELPGVDPKDVHLSVMGDQLFIKGERKVPEGFKEEECLLQECPYGPFERIVRLPHAVEEEKVEASYHEGILYIKLPAAMEKAKKIEIETEPKEIGTKEPQKELPKAA